SIITAFPTLHSAIPSISTLPLHDALPICPHDSIFSEHSVLGTPCPAGPRPTVPGRPQPGGITSAVIGWSHGYSNGQFSHPHPRPQRRARDPPARSRHLCDERTRRRRRDRERRRHRRLPPARYGGQLRERARSRRGGGGLRRRPVDAPHHLQDPRPLPRLGLAYRALHLIHWPTPSVGKYVETWRGLIELRERGLVKSIGVSNFTEAMLTELIDATGVTPAVNQVELHPYFPQADLIAFHRTIGVQTEAWSPLYRDQGLFDEAPIAEAAAAHGVTPAQVVLRWHLQIGSLPIPKSANPD